jgi:hypothetical protein
MKKNVTFIDDLVDMDSLTGGSDYISKGNMERDEYTNQVQNRHIRKHDKDLTYAMNGGIMQPNIPQLSHHNQHNQHIRENFQLQPFQQLPQHFPQQIIYEEPVIKNHRPFYDAEDLSCMTIANHIKDCPICSKFYNCDNSIYIVCIVLLIMVCVILLKKIIEK